MPLLPLALLSAVWGIQTQPTYVRDLSRPAPMLPQTQPFVQYTRPAYDFNITNVEAAQLKVEGKRPKQWWSGELGGLQVGGPILAAEAPFGSGANLLRSAYGMRLWGKQVGDSGWVDKADRMARLFLSQAGERTPVSFNFRTKTAAFGSMDEGGYASAVWLGRWLREYPDVDFAARAKAFIARAEAEAMADEGPSLDAAWLLADRWAHKEASGEAKRRFDRVLLAGGRRDARIFRVWDAVLEGEGVTGYHDSVLIQLDLHAPKTASGIANGVVQDGYIYASEEPEIWQDAALGILHMAAYEDLRRVFERGAQMIRATLTDFSAPGLTANNLAAPRGVPDGRAVNGNFGRSYAPVYKGFAYGEGHTLATLAMAQKRFGSVYYSTVGAPWAVGIDGIVVLEGQAYSGLSLNPASYDSLFPAYKKEGRSGSNPIEKIGQPPLMNAIREIVAEYRDNQTVVVAKTNAIQFSTAPEPSGVFIFADGTRMPANPGPGGFEVPVIEADLRGPVAFEGTLAGTALKAVGARVTMSPSFGSAGGWSTIGPMGKAFAAGGVTTKSTQAWGEMRSEVFTSPHKTLSFAWSGSGDAAVELWDVDSGNVLRRTSRASERETQVTWDLRGYASRRLQVRVVDNDPGSWVAVNSFRLR